MERGYTTRQTAIPDAILLNRPLAIKNERSCSAMPRSGMTWSKDPVPCRRCGNHLCSHERCDGSVIQGLKTEQIPLVREFRSADTFVYDSDRPIAVLFLLKHREK